MSASSLRVINFSILLPFSLPIHSSISQSRGSQGTGITHKSLWYKKNNVHILTSKGKRNMSKVCLSFCCWNLLFYKIIQLSGCLFFRIKSSFLFIQSSINFWSEMLARGVAKLNANCTVQLFFVSPPFVISLPCHLHTSILYLLTRDPVVINVPFERN